MKFYSSRLSEGNRISVHAIKSIESAGMTVNLLRKRYRNLAAKHGSKTAGIYRSQNDEIT